MIFEDSNLSSYFCWFLINRDISDRIVLDAYHTYLLYNKYQLSDKKLHNFLFGVTTKRPYLHWKTLLFCYSSIHLRPYHSTFHRVRTMQTFILLSLFASILNHLQILNRNIIFYIFVEVRDFLHWNKCKLKEIVWLFGLFFWLILGSLKCH